jgi:3D (Asp-Asp-Asp) domain-containing protein
MMRCLITLFGVAFLFLNATSAAGHRQSLLVRVTVYWRGEGSCQRASSNGMRLRNGHCAVDPRKIRFGSRVMFDDACLIAVDSGPAVISRKAARLCGRNACERNALVIDRFFETKKQALAWSASHPEFMNVRIIPPGPPLSLKMDPRTAKATSKPIHAAASAGAARSQPHRLAVAMNGLTLH